MAADNTVQMPPSPGEPTWQDEARRSFWRRSLKVVLSAAAIGFAGLLIYRALRSYGFEELRNAVLAVPVIATYCDRRKLYQNHGTWPAKTTSPRWQRAQTGASAFPGGV